MDHPTILKRHRDTLARHLYEITSIINNIDASSSTSPCLQQHREIAADHVRSITSTIVELRGIPDDTPTPNPCTFSVNDKVISLSAPNKNRIGFVTKVTQTYIHVHPIHIKYPPFKKFTCNLSHFPHHEFLPSSKATPPGATTSLEKSSPPPPITSSSPDTSTTISESSTPPKPKQPSPPRLPLPTHATGKPIQATGKRKRVQSILSHTSLTGARKRTRVRPSRATSIASTARCARSDTRQKQSTRSTRQRP